jgi:hypothetical protein
VDSHDQLVLELNFDVVILKNEEGPGFPLEHAGKYAIQVKHAKIL